MPVEDLIRLYGEIATIAVVGASADSHKQAYKVPKYLREQGYTVIPVNPHGGEILGEPVVGSLSEITGPVDAVEVFRPAQEAPAIAAAAADLGARLLWLQLGIVSDEARRIAEAAGMIVVMDACMGAVHRKLRRRHGLEPPRGPGLTRGR